MIARLHRSPHGLYNSLFRTSTLWLGKDRMMSIQPTDAVALSRGPAPATLPGAFAFGRGTIRGELFGPEGLRAWAAEIARASTRVAFTSGRTLLDNIARDSRILREAHRQIAAAPT